MFDLEAAREAVRRQLDSQCPSILKNCRFLCERLCEQPTHTDSDLLLLATCLQRLEDYRSALTTLDKISPVFFQHSEDAIYIKSFALFQLKSCSDAKMCMLFDYANKRMRTAQDLLHEYSSTNTVRIPKLAIGLHLLGLVTSAQNEDEEEAHAYFELAVKLDPYLFDARERLATSKGRAFRAVSSITTPEEKNDDLLSVLERANFLLASFQLEETITLLEQLGVDSCYAFALLARAWFERAEYAQAVVWYERVRKCDVNCTMGVEYYSTALWHLKRTVDLAYLARDMADRAPMRAETWIVVGNVFSLEKEHDLAIRFFKRALQLDENCTYAYTLAGHEHIANEDFDQATVCYRHALRTDRSHYNAWWGLGTIFARQEKHSLAQLHFQRALAIHPTSSVLCCYLGTVLAKMGRFDEALHSLNRAKELNPANPQARFQRARVLFRDERWEETLEELEFVRDAVPREASVHMFLGQVCSKLKMKDRAMVHFVAALDLDPKGAASVREAMNQMDSNQEEVDSYVEEPSQDDFDE